MGRLGEIKARHDAAMAQALLLALNLLRRNLDSEQVMLVVGENNRTVVETFKSANITGMIDVYPVNNPLSSDPSRRMLEMQQVVQMLGQVQDPVMQQRVIAAMQMENILQVEDELSVHRERALRENAKMERGEMAQIDPFDDDLIHMVTHLADHLSEESENDDPRVRSQRASHIQDHMRQMQSKQTGSPQPAPTQGGASPAGEPPQQPEPDQAMSPAAPQPAVA